MTISDEVGGAIRDDSSLPRPGTGQDEQGTLPVENGASLLGVEVVEEFHERLALGTSYSTVTLLARLRGWSTSHPRRTAM